MAGRMRNKFEISSVCRISRSNNIVDILHLGEQPLANSLMDKPTDSEFKIPLTLAYCLESSLLQIKETVDKEILFSNYVWVSGTASATRKYAKIFTQKIIDLAHLKLNDLVVEIGSNDGTFLKPFIESGYMNVIGVDPAANISEMANAGGICTLTQFWGKKTAERVANEYEKAKVIIARNVIPHVSELHDVIGGIEYLLRDDGIGVIEFHYGGNILEGLQYDSIYHEHLCYFSIKSIIYLLKLLNLVPFHADISPISGGSIVLYFSKNSRRQSEAFVQLVQNENFNKINEIETWEHFAKKCLQHKEKSLESISSFSNKTIVGFGASARSSTYLNFCGINYKQIKGVIDNNPIKQGKFTPGSSIPIVSFQDGLKMEPDIIFIFAWNFKDEIIRKCKEDGYKGNFLVAFPNEPKIIKV